MAEFESLKLSVTLDDQASAGLANLRTQITQLTQTAGQTTASLAQVAQGFQQAGTAAGQAAPAVKQTDRALSDLGKSAGDAASGVMQMVMSMRGGIGSLPQLALGLRQASLGIKGMSEGLSALSPAMHDVVIGYTILGVGITAVAATVGAASISLFRFSQSMNALNDTAKSVGVSFGELKHAIDEGSHWGATAETIIAGFDGIGKAQSNLAKNNSELRQSLMNKGIPADFLSQIQKENDPTKAKQLLWDRAQVFRKYLTDVEHMPAAGAEARVNEFMAEFGQDAGAATRPRPTDQTAYEEKTNKSIAEQSAKINVIWAEIYHTLKMIGYTVADWGLTPLVLGPLTLVKRIFDEIDAEVTQIKKDFQYLWDAMPEWFKNVVTGMANGPGEGDNPLAPFVNPLPPGPRPPRSFGDSFSDALRGTLNGPLGTPAPSTAPQTAPGLGLTLPEKVSYRTGDNDNVNPLFQRASFTTEELTDKTGQNTTETAKLTDQVTKLNDYYDRLRSGGAGGGPPGTGNGGGTGAGGGGSGGSGGGGGGGATTTATPAATETGPGGLPVQPGTVAPVLPPELGGAAKVPAAAAGAPAAAAGGTVPTAASPAAASPAAATNAATAASAAASAAASTAAAAPPAAPDFGSVLAKLPESVRGQAQGMFDKLSPSERADVFSGKTSVNDLITQKAPFGMGGIARSYIGSNYPGGMKGLQGDITTAGRPKAAAPAAPEASAQPQPFAGAGLYNPQTGDWIPGSGDPGFSGSNPNWGSDFRRSENIDDRRDQESGLTDGLTFNARRMLARRVGIDNRTSVLGNADAEIPPPSKLSRALGSDNLDRWGQPSIWERGVDWLGSKLTNPDELYPGKQTLPASGGIRGFYDPSILDRPALSATEGINSTGRLDVEVGSGATQDNKPRSDDLLKPTPMQRSTAFQETPSGPTVSDTVRQYMGGRN